MTLKKVPLYFTVLAFIFCAKAFSKKSLASAFHQKSEDIKSFVVLKKTEQSLKSPFEYSFRPLLIQGKKRLRQKTKDIKWESGHIAESQLFFVDIDFKERIFEGESAK